MWEITTPDGDKLVYVGRKLADDLAKAGYDMLNKVRSRMVLNEKVYAEARTAFAAEFRGL